MSEHLHWSVLVWISFVVYSFVDDQIIELTLCPRLCSDVHFETWIRDYKLECKRESGLHLNILPVDIE